MALDVGPADSISARDVGSSLEPEVMAAMAGPAAPVTGKPVLRATSCC